MDSVSAVTEVTAANDISNTGIIPQNYSNMKENLTDVRTAECEICNGVDGFNKYILTGQLVLASFMLTFNLLTMTAIYRCHQMAPAMRVSLLNLAFTDVVSSLAFGYHVTRTATEANQVNVECILRYVTFVGLIILTQVTIVLVSVDRFLSIGLAYRYHSLATTRNVRLAICLLWLYTAAWVCSGFTHMRPEPEACLYPLLMKPEIHILYAGGSMISTALIVTVNIYLLSYARRQIKKIAPTLVAMTSEAREQEVTRMSIKSIVTTVTVVVPFVVLNTPLYAYFFYIGVDSEFGRKSVGLTVLNVLSSAVTINSLVDPFIFVWRSGEIRDEVKRVLRAFTPCYRKD